MVMVHSILKIINYVEYCSTVCIVEIISKNLEVDSKFQIPIKMDEELKMDNFCHVSLDS